MTLAAEIAVSELIDALDRLLADRRIAQADRRQQTCELRASDRLLAERRIRDRRAR